MGFEVWIGGFPSVRGGGGTELDHLIDLLVAHGVAVHLVPTEPETNERMHESVRRRGCQVHRYVPGIFKDRIVLGFCNPALLRLLLRDAARARPARFIWFNCMTHLLPGEPELHAKGLIDCFGFVSEYQRRCLQPELERIAPVRTFPYKPFLNLERISWRYRSWEGIYSMGRVSRDDPSKFAPDTWRIFQRVLVPAGLRKRVFILGYGVQAQKRIGLPAPGLEHRLWKPYEVSAEELFRNIDTMIHKTGGSRESYCRVLVEAYAHGVVPIVENDYAFPELVIQGETGYRADTSDEMSYFASHLAMNPALHRRMAENGRKHAEALMRPEECWEPWEPLLRL